MECKYFGKCGSCSNFEGGYEAQLRRKVERERDRFSEIFNRDFSISSSNEKNFRGRSEFKVWHEGENISLAMRKVDGKDFIKIDSCPMVVEDISKLFQPLLSEIKKNHLLKERLFSIEFLSSTTGNLIATLIYHKKLENDWKEIAKELGKRFSISIIGRSRKQKVVLGKDFVSEKLKVGDETFVFHHIENSFSQPNPVVNEKMVNWVLDNLKKTETDLLELYCGSGNFTIPLSRKFHKVLATEVSKSAIATATENRERNKIENIEFGRVSSEEFVQAIDEVRHFNRLKHIDLKSYNFSTVFVDPPRAGIDQNTLKLLSRFEQIIYISCNPETLKRDIETLSNHNVQKMAIFDQFPYTNHLEMGAILQNSKIPSEIIK